MDVLIVTFKHEGASAEAWEQRAAELAPKFAAMPELLSKAWLGDAESDTYGGVYLWRDRASLDAYLAGPVFGALPEMPGVHSIETRSFAALDTPTRISGRIAGDHSRAA
jgi:quinol monooxygenase YgiN